MTIKNKISKNKNTIVLAAIGAGAIYFLMPRDEGEVGGFGGGGGALPLLPELADTPVGDIIYNIPTPSAEPIDWGIDWDMEENTDTKKATAVMDRYEKLYAPAQRAYDKSISLGAPTSADVAAYGKTKKSQIPEAKDTGTGVGFVDDFMNYFSADPQTRGQYTRKVIGKSATISAETEAGKRRSQFAFITGLLGMKAKEKAKSKKSSRASRSASKLGVSKYKPGSFSFKTSSN